MMDNVIEFKNVFFAYTEENGEILNDISLNIKKGEFVCILGHNGSGKSTVAKVMNGLLLPKGGNVTVFGYDTADEKYENEIRRHIGTVFQNPDNQIVATVVEDDVAFGPENLGVEPSEIRSRVDEALKTVGMYDYRKHEPSRLSGGQKQRIAIAGVLAMNTDCIVLDEPTAMLDPRGRLDVMRTLEKVNKELGLTVILVTHFMDEALKADRIIVINDGSVALEGAPADVFSHSDELKNMGLDVPKALELTERLREKGVELSDGILTADDFVKEFSSII